MSKKIYQYTEAGIRFKSERRSGEVRVPNYVYDLWIPLLGIETIGIYSVYCRLEREGDVKGLSQNKMAKLLRIGVHKLRDCNVKLERCGFIRIEKPQGVERLKHFTTAIIVLDPPHEVSIELIKQYEVKAGDYQALSAWLVNQDSVNSATPESESSNAGDLIQQRDEVQSSNATIASLLLHPSIVTEVAHSAGTKKELDAEFDAIKEVFGITAGGWIANMQGMVFGSKKVKGEWVKSKFDPPATVEELKRFSPYLRKRMAEKNIKDVPTAAVTIQRWFYDFRAEEAKKAVQAAQPMAIITFAPSPFKKFDEQFQAWQEEQDEVEAAS